MIRYICIAILLFIFNLVQAQEPTGFPTQFNTGWQQWGYQQSTKGTIIATRDTSWIPRYCGTMVLWPHSGVDTAYWMWDCVKWKKLTTSGDIIATAWGTITGTLSNQTDLQNALNLKFNIADTVNKWVQNVYSRNDSLFKFKNGIETFIDGLTVFANNGLTKVVDTIKLGGAFTQNTTWTSSNPSFRLTFTGNNTFAEGALFDVITNGSVGIAVRGESTDGRGVMGRATTGVGVYGTAGGVGGYGVFGISTLGNAIYGQADSGVIFEGLMNPTSNSTTIPAMTLTRSSQNAGVNGIAGSIDMYLKSSTLDRIANQIVWKWSTATDASRSSQLEFYGVNNTTLARKAALAGTGQWVWDGYPALTAQVDTTTYKPVAIDGSGNVVKMSGWTNTGGTVSGTGVANQITYWTGTNTIGGDAGMTVNPTTNTIKSDTSNVKKVDISGDSTFSDKIVFYPSKTKSGTSPAIIGYGEENNEYDLDSTVNNTLEMKLGPLNGAAGHYIRIGLEKRWRSFPGGPYWHEIHVPEVRLTDGTIIRPASYTGPVDGGEGVWTHRANLHSFYDWNGQKSIGGFSIGEGEFITYHNYSGNAITEMSIRDTGTSVRAAGLRIDGQVSAGTRLNRMDYYGQQIDQFYESAPVFRTGKGGANNSVFNYVFNIADTNTAAVLFAFTKGASILDNIYFWGHNDGRVISGDAGFFNIPYKFIAKQQGSSKAFFAGDFDANNNTILYASTFGHALTSGAGASGMGAGFDFRADNTSNTLTAIGDMAGVWSGVPTAGAENGDVFIRPMRTGTLTEAARFKSTGQTQLATYTTSNFVVVDTTSYKPAVFDASGNVYRMGGWPTGSIATTIYTGDGTIAGNRNVNVNNLNLTFSDVNTFRINHDVFAQSKADGTFPYSSVVVAPTQELRTGYTPTVGTFSKGAGITIDTNNNVSLGTGFITSSHPLYTYGSAFAQGFTSARGNFYRVDNYTADQTLTIEQYWINVDASGGNVTITLPAASTAFGSGVGIQYVIRRTDNSGNTLTVQRNGTPGTDTINGATSFTLTTQFEVKEVQAVSTSAYALK